MRATALRKLALGIGAVLVLYVGSTLLSLLMYPIGVGGGPFLYGYPDDGSIPAVVWVFFGYTVGIALIASGFLIRRFPLHPVVILILAAAVGIFRWSLIVNARGQSEQFQHLTLSMLFGIPLAITLALIPTMLWQRIIAIRPTPRWLPASPPSHPRLGLGLILAPIVLFFCLFVFALVHDIAGFVQ